MVLACGRDGRQDREPERAADLLVRVDETRLEPRLPVAGAGEGGDRHGHEGEAETDPDQDEADEEVAEVRAVDRDLREVRESAGQEEHSCGQHRLDSGSGHERLGHAGRDDCRQGDGEVADPRLHRREAEHVLHVQRKQEEHPEDRHAQEEADHVGAGQRAAPEDPERDER